MRGWRRMGAVTPAILDFGFALLAIGSFPVNLHGEGKLTGPPLPEVEDAPWRGEGFS